MVADESKYYNVYLVLTYLRINHSLLVCSSATSQNTSNETIIIIPINELLNVICPLKYFVF